MNKQLMKGILAKAMKDAVTATADKYTKSISILMLKDAGDVCAGSLDVLIVNQCRECENMVKRIQKNFNNASALIDFRMW